MATPICSTCALPRVLLAFEGHEPPYWLEVWLCPKCATTVKVVMVHDIVMPVVEVKP